MKGLRFLILAISTLSVSILISDCLAFNFTIICLIGPSETDGAAAHHNQTTTDNSSNITTRSQTPTYQWSREVQSMLLSSFAWSAALTVIPFTWALRKYGARRCYTATAILSAAAVFASPWAASISPYAFLVCRLCLGVGFGGIFPIPGAVIASWAKAGENGLFIGFLASAQQLAAIITMPMSGAICRSRVGWPLVYYVHGCLTLGFAIVWFLLYRDEPSQHPFNSDRHRIQDSAFKASPPAISAVAAPVPEKSSPAKTPFKALFTSLPIWAVMVATFGNMWGVQLLLYFTPTYLKLVLGFDVSSSGYLSALPSLAMFLVKFTTGFLSDRVLKNRPNISVKLFNSMAFGGMALSFAVIGFVENQTSAYVILVLSMAVLGLHSGGFFRSVPLIAGPFNSVVMCGVQFVTQVILIILPSIAAAITPNQTLPEWRTLFIVTAGVLMASNLFFIIFASGTLQDWAAKINAKPTKEASDVGLEVSVISGSRE